MKQRFVNSIMVTLEWRVIAFLITNAFLWATTGKLAESTAMALGLHAILMVAHFVWYFFRFGDQAGTKQTASVSE